MKTKPRQNKKQRPQGGGFKKPSSFKKPVREKRDHAPRKPQAAKISASLWGVHAVSEAWLNPARKIKALYITEQALRNFLPVYEQAKEKGLKRPMPTVLDKKDIDYSLPQAVHQGIALDTQPLEEVFLQDILISARNKENAVIVLLDQVTDPHNVGAIVRSASAFGAMGVVMQTRNAPEITGVLAKSACGAVDHIPIAYETNLSRALSELRAAGFHAIGLDERGESAIGDLPRRAKTVIVLGAEGKGLRPSLRDECDTLARLPTQGAILSLNVSNAAAVALYALIA